MPFIHLREICISFFWNYYDLVLCCAVLCLVAQLCLTLCDPMDYNPPGSSVHGDSPGKHTGVGCHALLQGIVPTQGLNAGLLHCRWILYHLCHQGSPRILEWLAYPFSSGSSCPRNWIQSPALQVDSLPAELPGKPSQGYVNVQTHPVVHFKIAVFY